MPESLPLTRRFLTVILLAAVITLASGCQPTGETTPVTTADLPAPGVTVVQEATPVQPTPTATPPYLTPLDHLRGLPITFLHPWVGDLADVVDQLTAEFNQNNEWGIRVSALTAGSSMALAERVENPPDGAQIPQVVLAPSEHLLTWMESGALVRPLNDYIADPVIGLTEHERAAYPLTFWGQDQSGGQQAGIPAQRDIPLIFYNQTWAAELGFTSAPETIEEFREQACAAADANSHDRIAANDGTGGWIVTTDGLVVYSWLKAFGLVNELAGDPLAFNFAQPAAQQTFEFFRGMLDEGCAWFPRTTSSHEYFANRQALLYTGSLTDLELQQKTQTRLESGDEWTLLPFPDGDMPVTIASGLSLGVFKGTPQQELGAWLFIRWLSRPENNARLLMAGGGLPVNSDVQQLVTPQIQDNPAWLEAIGWIPAVQTAPTTGSWRIARFVLQDAFWYAMQSSTAVEDFPEVLEQLDATIAEVQLVEGQ